MADQTTDNLLDKVQAYLQIGDKKKASILLNKILAHDFTNPTAWKFLHEILGKDMHFETFKTQFSQQYYPEKAHLLTDNARSSSFISDPKPSSRSTKKCPYCAEEILIDAIICRFCKCDLTKEHPDVIADKRKALTDTLAELEQDLAGLERELDEWKQTAQKEARATTQSEIVFFVGILLTPILIGFILIIISGSAYFSHKGKRTQAENTQTEIRLDIEDVRKEITELKLALTNL